MVYGNLFSESNNQEENSEISIMESLDIIQEYKAAKLPAELKIDEEDIINATRFKSKIQKIIKFLEDNNYTEKQISKTVSGFYYAIVGTTFYSSKQTDKYQPKIAWLATYINKYCIEKNKNRIKTDIERTIVTLDKRSEKEGGLSDFLKAYYTDIKNALSKLK